MRRKLAILATAMMILALTAPAGAELMEVTLFQNVSSNSATAAFTITPFDTTLGTLNSISMTEIVHVSGSAQLWTYAESSTLTWNASNTLAAISEMGWDARVASFTNSTTIDNGDVGYGSAGGWPITANGDAAPRSNTITAGFGRFVGSTPFDILLSLSGSASSTYESTTPAYGDGGPVLDENGDPMPYDTVIFVYDGTAQLYYAYDYTPAPVPEPLSLFLLGTGLMGLAGIRRFSR